MLEEEEEEGCWQPIYLLRKKSKSSTKHNGLEMDGTLQIVGPAELVTLDLGEDGPTETFVKEMMAYWESESKKEVVQNLETQYLKRWLWRETNKVMEDWSSSHSFCLPFASSFIRLNHLCCDLKEIQEFSISRSRCIWIVSGSCRWCCERRFNTMSIRLILLGFTVLSVPSTWTYRIQLSRISKTHTIHNSTILSQRKRLRYLLMRG